MVLTVSWRSEAGSLGHRLSAGESRQLQSGEPDATLMMSPYLVLG